MGLPFGLNWSDILPHRCCCGESIPGGCNDCSVDTTPCMRVRHVDWDESIPSLWLEAGTNNGGNYYCGESNITDQYQANTNALGPWSFDYVDPLPDDWYTCVDEYRGLIVTQRATPHGWPDSIVWEPGPSCQTNEVTLYVGEITESGTVGDVVAGETKFLPAEWWLDEFQLGDWVFTPATGCTIHAGCPTCLRLIGTGVDENLDTIEETRDFDQMVANCPPSSLFTRMGGACSMQGFARKDISGSLYRAVWWETNADRTTVTVRVGYGTITGATYGYVTEEASTTRTYAADWWVGGFTVGDYTVTACAECDAGCFPECLICPAPATLALVIEEDPECCLSGTFDMYYNVADDQWQTWPAALEGDPPTSPGLADRIGGPDGVCGIIEWAILSCGSDAEHVNLQIRYIDVNGGAFTANYDLAATCDPSFATDYATIASNPFAPGLCDGGFFRGSKLRVVEV